MVSVNFNLNENISVSNHITVTELVRHLPNINTKYNIDKVLDISGFSYVLTINCVFAFSVSEDLLCCITML